MGDRATKSDRRADFEYGSSEGRRSLHTRESTLSAVAASTNRYAAEALALALAEREARVARDG